MGDVPWFISVPLGVLLVLSCIAVGFILLDAIFEGCFRFLERLEEVRELRSEGKEDDDV